MTATDATGFDHRRLQQLDDVLGGYAARGEVPGLTWLVARHGEVHVGWAGVQEHGGSAPVDRRSIYRIASMTKPIAAACALTYVEDGTLRLDDPVDALLPELADRRVMVDPAGSVDDTVPARRPITLRDLLTFRLGWGMDFGAFATGARQALLERATEIGLGAPGPPKPQSVLPRDEWLRRWGTLPLSFQPGERWLYHTGSDVLGALLERVAGKPLGEVLRTRIFEPLGMDDTGFAVPAAELGRFGTCHADFGTGDAHAVFDARGDDWATEPTFASAAGGLVSTVDDYLAFAELLHGRGTARGVRLLSAPMVELMTADQLTASQREAGPGAGGSEGWGFGVGVQVRRTATTNVGTYGWTGGLGSSWCNDPVTGLTAILLTNQMFTSPALPPVHQDLLTGATAALDEMGVACAT
jgi:CubicO group peptidase (beta-lactamase class C family)